MFGYIIRTTKRTNVRTDMAIQTKDLWEQVRNKAWNKTRNRQKVRIAAQGCRTADSQIRRFAGSQAGRVHRFTELQIRKVFAPCVGRQISVQQNRDVKGSDTEMKLLASCCNCGHRFGRSADGTQTDLRCPKCGAEIEYIVGNNTVTVRLVRLSAKQQAARLKKYTDGHSSGGEAFR